MTELEKAALMALEAFERRERGIPQAHMAAQLVAELRQALTQALATPEPLNLSDPAVQKRLATQWGYVHATTEPVKPLFAAKVAAQKWAELQEQGHRMQTIWFDGGPGGAGTIDPWGKVTWSKTEPDVPETNFGNTTEPSNGFAWVPGHWATTERKGEPVAWGSPDGYWIRHQDKKLRPDSERFTEAFYTSPQVPEDTARLDWIERQSPTEFSIGLVFDYGHDGNYWCSPKSGHMYYGTTLREAIDAARKGE